VEKDPAGVRKWLITTAAIAGDHCECCPSIRGIAECGSALDQHNRLPRFDETSSIGGERVRLKFRVIDGRAPGSLFKPQGIEISSGWLSAGLPI
jgi:hypothetical protein